MARKTSKKTAKGKELSPYERRRQRYQKIMGIIGILIALSMLVPMLLQGLLR